MVKCKKSKNEFSPLFFKRGVGACLPYGVRQGELKNKI